MKAIIGDCHASCREYFFLIRIKEIKNEKESTDPTYYILAKPSGRT